MDDLKNSMLEETNIFNQMKSFISNRFETFHAEIYNTNKGEKILYIQENEFNELLRIGSVYKVICYLVNKCEQLNVLVLTYNGRIIDTYNFPTAEYERKLEIIIKSEFENSYSLCSGVCLDENMFKANEYGILREKMAEKVICRSQDCMFVVNNEKSDNEKQCCVSCNQLTKQLTKGKENVETKNLDYKPFVCPVNSCNKVYKLEKSYEKHLKMHELDKEEKFGLSLLLPSDIKVEISEDESVINNSDMLGDDNGVNDEFESEKVKLEELASNLNKDNILNSKLNQKTKNVEDRECEECKIKFEKLFNFREHMRKHHPNRYPCQQCDIGFPFKFSLVKHTKRVHDENKIMECQFCHKKYRSESELKYHTEKIHSYVPEQCEVCGKVIDKKNMKKHIMHVHENFKETHFKCEFCNVVFSNITVLNQHKNSHTNTRPYVCETCGNSFTHLKTLKMHKMCKHEKNFPYYCNVCKMGCISKTKLLEHSRIHTGEKPFACKFCTNKFARRDNLRSHTKKVHKVKEESV